MKDKLLFGTIGLVVVVAVSSAHAQLRLSFVGYSPTNDPRPIGSFDETVDDELVIDVNGMREPGPDGEWFLSWSSTSHVQNGYPALVDTDAWAACEQTMPGKYDVIAWLEPGDFMIGQQVPFNGGGSRVAFVRGQNWDGRMPWEYTHLRVVLVGEDSTNFQGPYCLRTYIIPIVWQEPPIPAASTTFGKIKALYRTKGETP